MQKQAKVINIIENQKQWQGNNGMIYYHEITFDNGDKGHYGSKTPTCEKFKVGEVADYMIEETIKGNYKNYKITVVHQNGPGGFKPKENKDQGIITALSCISSAVKFHENDAHATHENVLESAETFFNYAMSKSTLK